MIGKAWLACVAVAAAALLMLAAIGCRVDVDLGVAPESDAAAAHAGDAGSDAGG